MIFCYVPSVQPGQQMLETDISYVIMLNINHLSKSSVIFTVLLFIPLTN